MGCHKRRFSLPAKEAVEPELMAATAPILKK